jgi:hypothetical protein
MSLNPQKTKLMLITTRQKRQNLKTKLPPVLIDHQVVEEVDSHRVLGIQIDNNLSWKAHINSLCKTVSRQIYKLCKMKHFLNIHARKLFLHAHILSSINYCSTIFDGASANAMKPLFSRYKRAIKVVLLKSSSLQSIDYTTLGVLPLKKLLAVNKGLFMQKIVSGSTPPTLQSKFEQNYRHPSKLQVPIPRIDLFKSSLRYSGSLLWNTLPPKSAVPSKYSSLQETHCTTFQEFTYYLKLNIHIIV